MLILQKSDIDLSSEPGKGSTFSFDIAFEISENKESAAPAMIPGKGEVTPLQIRVLVAEDNEMNILILRKLFSYWDVQCEFVENGQQLLDVFNKMDFDLILMDLQMPVMDGYESTKRIRSMSNNLKAEIDVIAVTASAQIDVKEKAEKYNMNGFLSKPINPSALYKLLEYYSNKIVHSDSRAS